MKFAFLNASKAEFVSFDVSDAEKVQEGIRKAKEIFGQPVDILVNNAGIQFTSPTEDFPVEKFDQIIKINMSSNFYAIKAALPGSKFYDKKSFYLRRYEGAELGPNHKHFFRSWKSRFGEQDRLCCRKTRCFGNDKGSKMNCRVFLFSNFSGRGSRNSENRGHLQCDLSWLGFDTLS